jgi:predicted AAA+ superfamily ATPase
MRRTFIDALVRWKNKAHRKPLLLYGARQVGKTWMMKEFGRACYLNTVYVSFDLSPRPAEIFEPDLDPRRILAALSAEYHQEILPGKTLVILDEIQECGRALNSLKYFCEDAPEYHVIGAGSFLGVVTHEKTSFPVGKVDMLTMYPMTFSEFLDALGEEKITGIIARRDWPLIASLRSRLVELLKYYFYVGGMPEAVAAFAENRNPETVREIQLEIVRSYSADFSKHINASDIPKAGIIWNSVPSQLAKEKKKFVYNDMKSGARAREYENALNWLVSSGLVYKVSRVTLPNLPLISYEDKDCFKLYMLDLGLLGAKANLDIKALFEPNAEIFNHFKGALTEQYVLQELKALGDDTPVFYWTNARNTSEIDFILQKWNEVIPLEVKASVNLKAKSLAAYIASFEPRIALRASLAEYARHDRILELPLYLVGQYRELCR